MKNKFKLYFQAIDQKVEQIFNETSLGYDPAPLTIAISPDGLDIPLTPFQKLLLSLVGISHNRAAPYIRDEPAAILETYLDQGESRGIWLPPNTKIEKSDGNLIINFSHPITLLLLIAGRRSGKTTIASILMAWLARRILRCPDFLDDIPILPSSPVHILNVACDTHQAAILFNMLKENMRELGLIDSRNSSSQKIGKGRLKIHSLSSSSRSARGRTAAGACFDEFAHFQRSNGPLSDVEMWKALTPSLATFGNKSLAVIATTPAGRSGVVWDLFTQRGCREGMLTVQVPTRVMNPLVAQSFIESEYERDEYLSRQEYGAEFLAPHGTFLDRTSIIACTNAPLSPAPGNTLRHIHVDIGLQNDATAIAMGYLSKNSSSGSNIIIEHLEILQGTRDNPVSTSVIENRLLQLAENHAVRSITFDQHQSMYLVERLKSANLNASVIHASRKINWESYKYLKDLIMSRKIVLPDNERLIDELASLECDPSHDYPKVGAPVGGHDDCADAVAMCAWCLGMDKSGRWENIFEIIEGI